MRIPIMILLSLALMSCARPHLTDEPNRQALLGQVDAARLAKADAEPGQWFTSGRDSGGTYFSLLAQINEQTVKSLGCRWGSALGASRGLEASPTVVAGVLFAVRDFRP